MKQDPVVDEVLALRAVVEQLREGLDFAKDQWVKETARTNEACARIERLGAERNQAMADKMIANMKMIELEAKVERLKVLTRDAYQEGYETAGGMAWYPWWTDSKARRALEKK